MDNTKSQVDEAQRIAFNAVATAHLIEDRGFSLSDITLCFTAPLYLTLAAYLETMATIEIRISKSDKSEAFFYGYPLQIINSDEYAAYVSVATIK